MNLACFSDQVPFFFSQHMDNDIWRTEFDISRRTEFYYDRVKYIIYFTF